MEVNRIKHLNKLMGSAGSGQTGCSIADIDLTEEEDPCKFRVVAKIQSYSHSVFHKIGEDNSKVASYKQKKITSTRKTYTSMALNQQQYRLVSELIGMPCRTGENLASHHLEPFYALNGRQLPHLQSHSWNLHSSFIIDCIVAGHFPHFDARSRLFEIDGCQQIGKVCLVYRNTKQGIVFVLFYSGHLAILFI